jgi:hypothetical protein
MNLLAFPMWSGYVQLSALQMEKLQHTRLNQLWVIAYDDSLALETTAIKDGPGCKK